MSTSDSIFNIMKPADLGLPAKFTEFRATQKQALEWLMTGSDVMAARLPTGSGKTALAMAFSRLLNVRTVYLVATRALQRQVLDDFAPMGMVLIEGRANYECPNYRNCDTGHEEECSLHKTNACPYANAVTKANNAQLIVTNYAYWLWSRKNNQVALELNGDPIELLVCDEAHSIEGQLSSFASVAFSSHEIRGLSFPESGIMESPADRTERDYYADWISWAKARIMDLSESNDEDDEDMVQRCKKVTRMHANWVWQRTELGGVEFTPISLSNYTNSLIDGVTRSLFMSASLDAFTCRQILPREMSYEHRSWGTVFPPANAPIYHIPTVKLSWSSSNDDYDKIIATVDAICIERQDRKGIIHTVSYARMKRICEKSIHRDRFIWNENGWGLDAALKKFRNANYGAILVSPSVEEAHDFPADQCRYQILIKFPFPNERNIVVKERCNRIPGYRLHYAANKTVQIAGRPIRGPSDTAETFILDNAVRQLCGPEGKLYLPPGLRIFTVAKVPPPIPL